jgi:hypothetical protein
MGWRRWPIIEEVREMVNSIDSAGTLRSSVESLYTVFADLRADAVEQTFFKFADETYAEELSIAAGWLNHLIDSKRN